MPTLITSLQNARIKNIVRLSNRHQRDAKQVTVVEGVRECEAALGNGFAPIEAYICPELVAETGAAATAVADQLHQLSTQIPLQLFQVTPAVFAKIAYRGQSGGLLLLLPYWQRPLADLSLGQNPFVVIIEGGEKPGNLGAILRTADAVGADAVIISEEEQRRGTDMFNPNVIRASLGALFTVPVTTALTAEVIAWLRRKQMSIVAATPAGETLYTAVDLRGPLAIVMGSEAYGLGEGWLAAADYQVTIPMRGQMNSLNLSVSTAVMLYEVLRQRGEGSTD